jgi:hypothetical protein
MTAAPAVDDASPSVQAPKRRKNDRGIILCNIAIRTPVVTKAPLPGRGSVPPVGTPAFEKHPPGITIERLWIAQPDTPAPAMTNREGSICSMSVLHSA